MTFTDPTAPVPDGLITGEFVLRPLRAADAALDWDAVMETRETLRTWEQSEWPTDDFTVEENRADLVGLEERHEAHRAFTYTVLRPDGLEALGCVYVFPTDATFLARSTVTPLGETRWADVGAVVYFWARRSAVERGLDARLLGALRAWFSDDWDVGRAVVVASEPFRQQVELIESTDLSLLFELREPDKPERYLIYG